MPAADDEWSNEKTLKFIDLLATEPAIWDPKNNQYKLKHKVHDAWLRIGDAMDTPIEQLKTKKKSLMASFRPLIKKKKASLRSGCSADEVYQPTWFAYDAMEIFLGPIYEVNKTINTEANAKAPSPRNTYGTLLSLPCNEVSGGKWSNEKTLEFIDLLAAEPAIWDPKNKQHKLKHKVHDAWVRIGEAMDTPIEQLKAKKKSLMASFRPLINKKKASLRSGCSADEVYQPTWFAYDAMEIFLGPIYEVNNTINTEVNSKNENTEDENTQYANTQDKNTWNKNASTSVQRKRRQNFDIDNAQTQLNNSFQTLNNILSNKQEKDECDCYAELLAIKLRKYPDGIRQRIMHKIDGFLLENTHSYQQPLSFSSYSSSPTGYSRHHSSTPSPAYINPQSPTNTDPLEQS